MKVYRYPKRDQWEDILQRPVAELEEILEQINPILQNVKKNGDKALLEYTKRFDGVELDSLKVADKEWDSVQTLDPKLKEAIDVAFSTIWKFHEEQKLKSKTVQTLPGVYCWQKEIPIEKVGLYIPGGTAPLFSTMLMLGIPAVIAGCSEIVTCTPPQKDGTVHPAVLYVAKKLNCKKVIKAGGSQAIGAMIYGSESVPSVYKIFGPGNQYVTAAKQAALLRGVAIDMPAGPSEVAVIADKDANPTFIAADLLSQAEHGVDSQVVLFTDHEPLIEKVESEIERLLELLPRKEVALESLKNSAVVLCENIKTALDMSNYYGPEHLIIQTENPKDVAEGVINGGSIFIGKYSPESAGDYASGTNHTLPTNGYAKMYSGVGLSSYMKTVTFQEITAEGFQKLGPTIEILAENEALDAHKMAATVRLESINKQGNK